MLASFSEFKFYQSFRIPVEEADDLRFLVQMAREKGGAEEASKVGSAPPDRVAAKFTIGLDDHGSQWFEFRPIQLKQILHGDPSVGLFLGQIRNIQQPGNEADNNEEEHYQKYFLAIHGKFPPDAFESSGYPEPLIWDLVQCALFIW